MKHSRSNILSIFQNNTGGKTTTGIPRIETDPVKLCGYQPPRVQKIRKW